MKVRGTLVSTPLGARLTALCWAALTLLVPVAVSACTSGTTTSTPTIFSPTTTGTASGTAGAISGGSPTSDGSPGAGGGSAPNTAGGAPAPVNTAAVAPPATVTVTATVTVVPAYALPRGAVNTGGGGTAGFQNTLLLTLGAVAILAGAGGLIYRRWLGRER
jgi:hypothetical protein